MIDKKMKLLNIVTSKYFSFLCFLCGILSFSMLSQLEFSQRTYMSENALLVGLVKQQFNNITAINQFYREYSSVVKNIDNKIVVNWLKETMENIGLDVGVQNFTFQYDKLINKQKFDGQNVYGILRSPGAARMQAILITAPLRYGDDNMQDSQPLLASVACMLALAQHARGKLYWATDIIFLFTDMEYVGMKSWLMGYSGVQHTNNYIVASDLLIRSGSILAGFNVEIATQHIPYLEFRVESLNGQLPNLDLFNTVVRLSMDLDIPVRVHGVPAASSASIESRLRSLRSMLSMMWSQSSGSPNGLHGLLADFQIPSLTIYSPPTSRASDSKTNLYDITKLLESTLRCLNSLQERLHQSFFFYLLPGSLKYVSIGMYMPAFGLVAVLPLLLTSIQSLLFFGSLIKKQRDDKINNEKKDRDDDDKMKDDLFNWSVLCKFLSIAFGVGFLVNCSLDYFFSLSHSFNINPDTALLMASGILTLSMITFCKIKIMEHHHETIVLLQTASRLLLGLFLSSLSLLNISMSLFLSLAIVPAALFVYPYRNRFLRTAVILFLILISPLSLIFLASVVHCKLVAGIQFVWTDVELYKTALTYTRHSLIQGWVERDLLGSWTVDILTLGYTPFWIMNWALATIQH